MIMKTSCRFVAFPSMLSRNPKILTSRVQQCVIPVFDGLLPEPHNTSILKLIFTCEHWHTLAKLCMHMDLTLNILDSETARLGREFRSFVKNTCPSFATKELRQEETAARKRRQLKKLTQSVPNLQETLSAGAFPSDIQHNRLFKMFNLQTVKFHLLGDHADTIHEFGTNDSHLTEPVCCNSFPLSI